MNEKDIAEQSYKNGYAQALKDIVPDGYRATWKLKFFAAQKENERLQAENEQLTDTLNQYINGELINAETMGKIISLEKQVNELKKPINDKFKDNAALQKAYESLEKEFTRRSQRLKELQKNNADLVEERENMQAEILRFEDMKFTQEHCDLYSENEWLKAELEKAYETERANIQAEIAEAGTSCHWCKQQIVKDKAKEIFAELLKAENVRIEIVRNEYGDEYVISVVTVDKIKEIAKEKGVEVE